jgi:ketosteroid isomerase-like protein
MAGSDQSNAELMQTLDDAWNSEDIDVFRARHKPDVIVRWPGQPEPTRGIEDHIKESQWFWEAFPDQHLDNRPYRIFLASGDYTSSVAHFTGTMTGPLKSWNGPEIPPTGKSFEVDFYTVAQWHEGQIVEENLMYDLVIFMQQLGLSG